MERRRIHLLPGRTRRLLMAQNPYAYRYQLYYPAVTEDTLKIEAKKAGLNDRFLDYSRLQPYRLVGHYDEYGDVVEAGKREKTTNLKVMDSKAYLVKGAPQMHVCEVYDFQDFVWKSTVEVTPKLGFPHDRAAAHV